MHEHGKYEQANDAQFEVLSKAEIGEKKTREKQKKSNEQVKEKRSSNRTKRLTRDGADTAWNDGLQRWEQVRRRAADRGEMIV